MTAIQQEIWAASVPVLFTLAKSPAQPGAPSSPSPPQKSPRNSPKPFSKPSSPAIGSSSPKLNSPQPPQSENFAQDTETSAQLPYAVNIPRLSYLPLLLPKLSAFFGRKLSSFSYEGIELRPLPVGLLVDLYGPELPWRIEVGEGFGGGVRGVKELEDAWMNSVKEVCLPIFTCLNLSLDEFTSLDHCKDEMVRSR